MSLKKKLSAKNQLPLFPQEEKPIILEDLSWMTEKQIYGGILPGSPEEKACALLVKLLTVGKTDNEK
jgi:hypothetical protein